MARKPSKPNDEPQLPGLALFTKWGVLSDDNSCLNRASDDEPVFILRANDPLAPTVIRSWAERYRERKGHSMDKEPRELAKYLDAYEIARAMEAWKIGQALTLDHEDNED